MNLRALVTAIAVTFVLLSVVPAYGQAYPAFEGFIGFSLLNNDYGTVRHNSPGVQFNFGFNPLRRVRLITDLSAQFHGSEMRFGGEDVRLNEYRIMFGPEFVFRNRSRATPFAHILVGYARRSYSIPTGEWSCDYDGCSEDQFTLVRDSGFATAVGGGLDVDIRPNYGIRLIQFDYMRANLNRDYPDFVPDEGALPVINSWQKDYRISAGFYFRFGQRGNR